MANSSDANASNASICEVRCSAKPLMIQNPQKRIDFSIHFILAFILIKCLHVFSGIESESK